MAKNAIKKVQDELSLDYANGKYLNVLTSNYGLTRPIAGYSDDLWRAVCKKVMLDYKQIYNKFADILDLVIGPKYTIVAALSQTAQVGSKTLFLHDASKFPQIGKLVLDKNTPREEVINYRFIDYSSNTIFLSSPTQYIHYSNPTDVEVYGLYSSVGDTSIICSSSAQFPSTSCSIVVGLGTDREEILECSGKSLDQKTLLLADSVTTHNVVKPTLLSTSLLRPYTKGSFYLTVNNTDALSDSGMLLLGRSSNTFAVTSSSSYVINTSTLLEADKLIGYRLVFTGNVTTSIANQEYTIVANSINTITLNSIPTAALGDTFYLRPVVEYTGKAVLESSVNLKYVIPSYISLAAGTSVEVLENNFPVALSTVAVLGTGWEISQTESNVVEIVIPFDEEQLQNLRSASYLHGTSAVTGSTTLTSPTSIGATSIMVGSTSTFQTTGTLEIAGEAYFFIKDSSTVLRIPRGIVAINATGTSVIETAVGYAGTDVRDGNYAASLTWQGPYIYAEDTYSPKYNARTTLAQHLAGPTKLSVDVLAGAGPRALEVENASLFPLTGTFSIQVGTENMTVTSVSLKSRTFTNSTGAISAGATSFVVTNLTTAISGGNIPIASGYRLLIGRGTSTPEIVYVTSVNSGSNTIAIQSGLQYSHSSGVVVELLKDTLVVSQIDTAHTGIVSYSNRAPISTTIVPEAEIPVFSFDLAETVQVRYSTVSITSGTNFPTSTTEVLLSYGNNKSNISSRLTAVANSGSVSLELENSSKFPTVYPYFVEINSKTRFSDVVEVISNNIGSNTLFINTSSGHGAPMYSHAVLSTVSYLGSGTENAKYASRSGNTLTFSPPLVLKYDHQRNDDINVARESIPSKFGYGYPFRMPLSYFEKLEYLLNLVRAAGVAVKFIRT